MGSSYLGEANIMGSDERGSGSSSSSYNSSSSRKGKKNNSEKPNKQPQRGLGVAQLEKIRLHGHIDSGFPIPPPNFPSTPFNHAEDPTIIRVQTPYPSLPSSSSYCFHPNISVMGLPEYERTNITFGNSHPTNTPRWGNANSILQTQSSAEPNVTRPFLNLYDSQHIDTKNHRSVPMRPNMTQNSESSDSQEPDLELRLSL